MPRLRFDDLDRLNSTANDRDTLDLLDDPHDDRYRARHAGGQRRRPARDAVRLDGPPKQRRPDGRESFKCGHCRAFIGPTVSGGRHRNHCPLCLTSRHVDGKRPGDRGQPVPGANDGDRRLQPAEGEQVVLHRCRGCGVERHNRIAADDNPLALLRLPPVAPRLGGQTIREEEAIA